MTEWHLPPGYIIENWTDELLALMCEKLVERKQREADAIKGTSSDGGDTPREVSVDELLHTAGSFIKVVK